MDLNAIAKGMLKLILIGYARVKWIIRKSTGIFDGFARFWLTAVMDCIYIRYTAHDNTLQYKTLHRIALH